MNEQKERLAFIECGKNDSRLSIIYKGRVIELKEIELAEQGEQLYRKIMEVRQGAREETVFEQVIVPASGERDFSEWERQIDQLEHAITLSKDCWHAAEADLKNAKMDNEQLLNSLNEARASESIALNKAQHYIEALAEANKKVEKLTKALDETNVSKRTAWSNEFFYRKSNEQAEAKIAQLTKDCAEWEEKFTAEKNTLNTVILRGAELEKTLKDAQHWNAELNANHVKSLKEEIKRLKEQSHKIEWIPYVHGVTKVGVDYVVWARFETKASSKWVGYFSNCDDATHYIPLPPVAPPIDEAGIALDQWLDGGIATASSMIAFKSGFNAAKSQEPKGENFIRNKKEQLQKEYESCVDCGDFYQASEIKDELDKIEPSPQEPKGEK